MTITRSKTCPSEKHSVSSLDFQTSQTGHISVPRVLQSYQKKWPSFRKRFRQSSRQQRCRRDRVQGPASREPSSSDFTPTSISWYSGQQNLHQLQIYAAPPHLSSINTVNTQPVQRDDRDTFTCVAASSIRVHHPISGLHANAPQATIRPTQAGNHSTSRERYDG